MSEGLRWDILHGLYPQQVYKFPATAESSGDAIYLRKVSGVWLMDAGFDVRNWNWEPIEGVNNLKEAKAVAIAIWRMR